MKKEIKIVQFVEAFGGGVYTYVKDLCNFIALHPETSHYKIHLIYSSNRVEFDEEIFQKEIHPNVVLHLLEMNRKIDLKNDTKVIAQTRRLLKKIKPDILHLHSSKASVIGRIASFGLIRRKRMFYSPHGYAFVQRNISIKKIIFYKGVEYLMPFLFGGITVASGNTEFEIAKNISKAIIVRNGVDFCLPQKCYDRTENTTLTIGTIGRLTPQKNPKAFNEIAKKLPDINFIWIGNGELIDDITSENITVTGWVKTREELLTLLNKIDIYIQVSLWEGLPIALIEAMAMKKPLVVSNIIGNKDCVDNGFNGYVFDSVEEAVFQINQLKNDSKRLGFGNNSFEKAYKEYNKEKNFSELINIYLGSL